MTTYAVTAATGQLGRLVVEELLERGVEAGDVVAVVRSPAKAADLATRGVRVREGDYSRPQTLPAALEGVDRLLLVSGSEVGRRVEQHANVVRAAEAAGVGRLVYTSILKASTTGNPLAPEHAATEEVLRDSPVPTVVLRNGWYTENYSASLPQYLATGEVVGATGDGRISAASRADFAAAAAGALLGEDALVGLDGGAHAVHELGGPSFTLAELAEAVSAATGQRVAHRDLSEEELAAHLRGAGLDEGTAAFVAALDASIARGELETDPGALEVLAGRPATPLATVLADAAATRG
ncbi:SDR family oxidoreductase [Kineococcus terrestris]|uniref:SDR family oxidoreductase n=1 Tax=Kineococcus terrestris TaxID=2044856 RepID=UPI0034DAF3B2